MRHIPFLFLLPCLFWFGCAERPPFYLWVLADNERVIPQGQLIVNLSYDGVVRELRIPEDTTELTLPNDFTITFEPGFEPSAAHENGTFPISIDAVDQNQCVVACGTISSALCCSDSSRFGAAKEPISVPLFPLGSLECPAPVTVLGNDCR